MKCTKIFKLKILLVSFLIIGGCSKKEDSKEKSLKKQIYSYQKLDRESIKKVFHSSEITSLKEAIKEKCKLQDIKINSFYISNPQKRLVSLSVQNLKIDMNSKFADITPFVNFIKNYKKHIGISEFIIDSKQTGYHRVYLSLQIITKDYLDKEFIPKIIKAVAGLSIDNIDYLKASLKVYKSRHYIVSKIIKQETLNWKEILDSLTVIPEKTFIKQLHYFRSLNSEQMKLSVQLAITDSVISSSNLFFKGNTITKYFKNFSMKRTPSQIEGTKRASTIYLYQN